MHIVHPDCFWNLQVLGNPILELAQGRAAAFLLAILFKPGSLGLSHADDAALNRMTALAQVGHPTSLLEQHLQFKLPLHVGKRSCRAFEWC